MRRGSRLAKSELEYRLTDLLALERRRRGHSQKWLAEKLGLVNQTSVSRVESGGSGMTLTYFLSACRVMNISAGRLLDRAEHVERLHGETDQRDADSRRHA